MAESKSAPQQQSPEIWAGLECTINRVGDAYFDQLQYADHYRRCGSDIAALRQLGIRTLRYPLLWERHQPDRTTPVDWRFADEATGAMRLAGITPIAGLVHHGSGPSWVSFYDGSFEAGLREYSRQVALRYPWIEYYTPVNEPLTTARFCGLYGHWYPHATDTGRFARILVSECRGIVMAMEAIRGINPAAKLVQTEDLGRTYCTALLRYQADHENRRRLLAFDLLCGRLDRAHRMWSYLREAGISEDELQFFLDHPTPPDIMGLNYYITSERYLDEDLAHYPPHTHGGNGIHSYADVEAVRVPVREETGPAPLIRLIWDRYRLPIAVTEAHLHCSREHQCRWLDYIWKTASGLRSEEGIDIRAVTAWAAFGSFGWNDLLRHPHGAYELGVFDVRSGTPRPTALASMIRSLAERGEFEHPSVQAQGWWQQDTRMIYRAPVRPKKAHDPAPSSGAPLLILGKTGTLGRAFSQACAERGIPHVLWGRQELDVCHTESIGGLLDGLKPWAVINATGYVRVQDAEREEEHCREVNCVGAVALARACAARGIQLMRFSSDLVFDGAKGSPYTEDDAVRPLNAYGRSKAEAEWGILREHPGAMIVRTSAFFSPSDTYNFLHAVLRELEAGRTFTAVEDVVVTPTYVPDLVAEALDLLQDASEGIWHITNGHPLSWAELAREAARRASHDPGRILPVPQSEMAWPAMQPPNSALISSRGISLPSLDHALDRHFAAIRPAVCQPVI